jgi:precorrin-6B methylase 2
MITSPNRTLHAVFIGAALTFCGLAVAAPLPAIAQAASEAPKLDVPFVPTPQETVDRMLAMAKVGPNDFLIDLGSGDGRIPITAAKKFGIRAMGVDLNPVRIAESKANAKEAGVSDKVEFVQGDLFQQDISKATVLTMYLLPDVNMKLRPKIWKDLKPGTRVVSHAFSMGDWTPDATTTGPDGRNTVYLWIVPDPKVGPKGVKK